MAGVQPRPNPDDVFEVQRTGDLCSKGADKHFEMQRTKIFFHHHQPD